MEVAAVEGGTMEAQEAVMSNLVSLGYIAWTVLKSVNINPVLNHVDVSKGFSIKMLEAQRCLHQNSYRTK